jgi:hypothetical protein
MKSSLSSHEECEAVRVEATNCAAGVRSLWRPEVARKRPAVWGRNQLGRLSYLEEVAQQSPGSRFAHPG